MADTIPFEPGLSWFVARIAETAPGVRALIHGDLVISYGELQALSNEVSEALVGSGCRPGDRVATWLPHSAAAIVALLGIQKAGCVAVPLAFGGSGESLLPLIALCQCKMLLVLSGQVSIVSTLEVGTPAINMDRNARPTVLGINLLPVIGTGDLLPPPESDAIAEILMHDQGGISPQGVMVTHPNIAALADSVVSAAGVVPTDRICGANPLHTGLSLFDMVAAFCAGAQLHIPPDDAQRDFVRLTGWLQASEISVWLARPAVLRRFAHTDLLSGTRLPSLKRLFWSGEILPVKVLMYLMERLRSTVFANVYGQLETGIAACMYKVSAPPLAADMVLPVGTAVVGTLVQVLDDSLKPAAQGDIGRLSVSGPGVVPGYWRDSTATQEAFRRDANGRCWFVTGDLGYVGYDGLIYLVGRSSERIRHAGHEVSIAAVEHALGCLDYVNDAAVVPYPGDQAENRQLACAYIPAGRSCFGMTRRRLRRDVNALLPDYMVPERWFEVSDLPCTISGKLDRSLISQMIYKSESDGKKAGVR